MRILIVRNYPTTFELENRCYNIQEIGLARALRRRGHACDVVFFCANRPRLCEVACENGPICVHYIRAVRVLKCGVFPRALDDLAAGYDIVQLSEYNQIQAFWYARRFERKAVILHGPYFSPFNWRYNLLCRAVDVLFLPRYRRLGTHFMVKSAQAERFLRGKGIDPAHIDRVYVGLDEQAFAGEAGPLPERLSRALSGDAPVLAYVGAIEPRRKSMFLLDVFDAVRKRAPSARLAIVGDGKAAYKRRFAARMRKLGIGAHVVWVERLEQPSLAALYRRASAFLFPTAFDIFGMALLEAMYFGVPVIASPCGGTDALIRDGENGFVMAEDAPERWAACAARLLEDPALCGRIGAAARATVCGSFTWDAVSGRYLESYRRKLEEGGEKDERGSGARQRDHTGVQHGA